MYCVLRSSLHLCAFVFCKRETAYELRISDWSSDVCSSDLSYDEYNAPLPTGDDLATAPLERTPKSQWTVNANYETEVAEAVLVTANGSVSYTGRNLYNLSVVSPDRSTFLDAHTVVNATLTLSDPDKSRYVRLIGRNLTDKRYLVASQLVGNLDRKSTRLNSSH